MGWMNPRKPFSSLFHHDAERVSTEADERGHVDLHRAMRSVRRMTHDVELAFAKKPLVVLGAVAVASYVLGALTASRLVRAVAIVSLGYLIGTERETAKKT
jgi:hypothetical protein